MQSPHHGGLWEAAICEMKRTMFKILGPNKLLFEHLVTLLHKPEVNLSSRPIVPFDTLHEDGCPLTPLRMLILSRRECVQASPHRLKRIRPQSDKYILYHVYTHSYLYYCVRIYTLQPACWFTFVSIYHS